MSTLSSLVKIKLSAPQKTENELKFSYTASNAAGRDVYVFNILPPAKKGETVAIDPGRAYTEIEGTELVVSKRLVEVPKGVRALAPEIPFLTMLSPGEELAEIITLRLPVHEDIPYKRRETRNLPERLHACKSLVFVLGFLTPPEPRWIRRSSIEGRHLFATDYGFAIQMNLFAVSEIAQISVDCMF